MSTGIEFHMDGAAERKAREPITVLIRGTVRVPDSDDPNIVARRQSIKVYGTKLWNSLSPSLKNLN